MENKVNWVTISNPRDERASYQRDRKIILGDIDSVIKFKIIFDPTGWLEDEDHSWGLWVWVERKWEHIGWDTELDWAREGAVKHKFLD